MDTIKLTYDLFNHMSWADHLIWQAVLETLQALEDSEIFENLHHIHLCQQAWLLIWQEKPIDADAGKSLNLIGLNQWARQYHQDVIKYLTNIQESDLERPINVPGVDANHPYAPSLRETFIQITTHSTYHRGQVSKHLRKIGGVPPQTDYIKWVLMGKPMANWSAQ